MASFDVCLLLLMIAVTAAETNFPILNEVRNLRVGKETDETAVVVWDFVKPENVSFQRIEFLIQVESEGKPTRKMRPRFSRPPFRFHLTGLLPAQKYIVKVSVTSPNWQDSPVTEISFVSLETDWPTPVITKVRPTPRKDFVDFQISWEVKHLMHWLRYYTIAICAPSCAEIRKDRSVSKISLPMTYKTSFTLKVTAVYKVPDIGEIKRTSKEYAGETHEDIVGEILGSPLRAEQDGNYVKLRWLPSFGPKGPHPFYEFFVFDPKCGSKNISTLGRPPSSKEISRAREAIENFRVPELQGLAFRMNLRSERDDTSVLGPDAADANAEQCMGDKPPILLVIKKIPVGVRFRVVFRNRYDGFEDEASDPNWISNHLRFGPGVAEAFGLPYYTRFTVNVRSCLHYATETIDKCGNFSVFNTLSNPAAPSKVRSLRWDLGSTDEAVEVMWEEPEYPRGPISGYKITVQQMQDEKPFGAEVERWLKPDVRSYVFHEFDPQITYEVAVVAYNVHLEDDALLLVSERSHILIGSAGHWVLWEVISLLVLHTIAIILLWALIQCLTAKRRTGTRNQEQEQAIEMDRLDGFNDPDRPGNRRNPPRAVRALVIPQPVPERHLPDVARTPSGQDSTRHYDDDVSHHSDRDSALERRHDVSLYSGESGEEPYADMYPDSESSSGSEDVSYVLDRLRQLLGYGVSSGSEGESAEEAASGDDDSMPRTI